MKNYSVASTNRKEMINKKPEKSALDVQVSGTHYKTLSIQPIEFIVKNKMGFIEGNVVKYISRYKDKGGVEDLKKVKHYIDLLIELEYPESK